MKKINNFILKKKTCLKSVILDMESFKGESIIDFFDTFKTDLDCLEYLASIKWKGDFKCSKYNHAKFTIRKLNFARDCNLCHHVESPTANTIFHKVKFGTRKVFGIVFEMSATTKSLSLSQMVKRYSIKSANRLVIYA